MEQTMLVRLKAHEPKKGLVLKQYTYKGIRFQAGRGWYKVSGELAAYLANVHSVPSDPDTPLAFDVRTLEEARAMDENDRKAARQVLPAEEPLDVSHVRDEPPSVNRQRSTERDDATRQQRRPARSPEDEQLDAAEDGAIEDAAPRRRAPRRRSQAVPRQRARAAEEFEEADELDENDFEDDEALRRRARRSRTEVAPRHHARAADVEDFDALDEDEFDALDEDEFDALDEDEFDDDEELQSEPPLRRHRVEAKASRHGRGYDRDDDAPVRRSRRYADEFEELEEFNGEDIEDAPPPRRLTHRSHDLRARRPLSRAADGYDRDDALDDDRQTRRVRGARQAEALDAFRNREARRMRRQDQYEEMPARRVHEDVVERELDDEPTQKVRRPRSQEDQQHELHTRHARQMAAKLGQMDALDDAMSHGDAEDCRVGPGDGPRTPLRSVHGDFHHTAPPLEESHGAVTSRSVCRSGAPEAETVPDSRETASIAGASVDLDAEAT